MSRSFQPSSQGPILHSRLQACKELFHAFCPYATYGYEETSPFKYKILRFSQSHSPRQILESESHLRVGFAPNRPPPLPPLQETCLKT